MAKTVILHIQGNEITLAFPLAEVEYLLTDGDKTVNVEEKPISPTVWVVLNRGILVRQYKARVRNNYIVFTDHGHLPCGEYDITVLYDVGRDYRPMRYKTDALLAVVDTTEAGQVYQSTDFDVVAYYPIIKGRASAVEIGDDYVRLIAGNGLRADIDEDSVNLRAGYGNSTVEVTENNVNININE